MVLLVSVIVLDIRIYCACIGGRYTHPQTMYPRLRGIPIRSHAVPVAWQTVHDGPTNTTGAVDLQTEVIVRARDGVVVLVDDKVGAAW